MDLTSVQRILIIKLRYIGDVLLATPVIANLRHHFPDALIQMLVNRGTDPILRYNPHLNGVITLDRDLVKGRWFNRIRGSLRYVRTIRRDRYDLIVDLTDGDRSAILGYLSGAPIRLGYNADGFIRGILYTHMVSASHDRLHNVEYQLEAVRSLGLPIVEKRLDLRWSKEEEEFIEKWITTNGLSNRPFVTIHPGGRWWFKQWPLERFSKLAEILWDNYGLETVFLGGQKEREELKVIERVLKRPFFSAEGMSLLQTSALVRRSQLFIGNDNGPMHIASAVGTPLVALFGSSDPKVWGPWGEKYRVIYKGVPCSPCSHTGCDMGELNCMRQISVSEVVREVEALWKENRD